LHTCYKQWRVIFLRDIMHLLHKKVDMIKLYQGDHDLVSPSQLKWRCCNQHQQERSKWTLEENCRELTPSHNKVERERERGLSLNPKPYPPSPPSFVHKRTTIAQNGESIRRRKFHTNCILLQRNLTHLTFSMSDGFFGPSTSH